MRTLALLFAAAIAVSEVPAVRAAAPEEVGVVLMHGWGLIRNRPPGHISHTLRNDPLASALKREGFHVLQPEMPWGPNRILEAALDTAMEELDGQVSKLKAAGAKKIVIAGHSMGAPMALAYVGRREGLAGVIALAPGHHPELQPKMFPDFYPKQIAEARGLVAAGKGNARTTFKAAQCCFFFDDFQSTPIAYLSYFDPAGPGTMAGNAAGLKPGVPVLVVFGKRDGIFKQLAAFNESLADYIWSRIPPHPLHRRVTIDADHGQVPERSVEDVIRWLRSLP